MFGTVIYESIGLLTWLDVFGLSGMKRPMMNYEEKAHSETMSFAEYVRRSNIRETEL